MKKLLLSSAILATFALFSACGDDSSSGPEEESSSSIEVEEKSSSSVEEEGKSSAADKKSSSSEAKKGDSSSSEEATSSSSEAESSSSIAEESSSSSVIASSSGAKQSSSSEDVSSSSEESSSSAKQSSSSEEESSSSEAVAEVMPSDTYNCASYNCVSTEYLNRDMLDTNGYGEILDTRDNQVYKVVTIGDQVWMAQNLNYAYNVRTSSLDSSSFCYNGKADSCAKYGRLYLWSAAMDSAGVFSSDGEGCDIDAACGASGAIRGVCPKGWHLPSLAEWKRLLEPMATSIDDHSSYWYYYGAGRMLKSEDGWGYYSESTKGIDYSGFSALPAGDRYYNGYFVNAGYDAFFWSSSEMINSDVAYIMDLSFNGEYAGLYDDDKNYAFSVRCIKD
ncbi:MAG: fibrobacter succinogenes major paralogous domain-containing protein [Fibrobacter sp.]|nr:fibrobacter succinogenes major paralogous domain-containing protein [Fibrobacter sp.]